MCACVHRGQKMVLSGLVLELTGASEHPECGLGTEPHYFRRTGVVFNFWTITIASSPILRQISCWTHSSPIDGWPVSSRSMSLSLECLDYRHVALSRAFAWVQGPQENPLLLDVSPAPLIFALGTGRTWGGILGTLTVLCGGVCHSRNSHHGIKSYLPVFKEKPMLCWVNQIPAEFIFFSTDINWTFSIFSWLLRIPTWASLFQSTITHLMERE